MTKSSYPIIPSKTGMLFFDTLNGSASQEARDAIRATGYIDRLVKIEQACRKAGIAIFYTQPEHRQDGRDWAVRVVGAAAEPRLTTYAGLNYKGSHHAEVIPEIAPQPGDYVIAKHRWSAFYQTSLDLSLRTAGIDTIMLAGGATQVGIASTAYAARDHDYNLVILSDAIRGRPEVDELFLSQIFPGMARILTIDEAISLFASA